jgi:hypothetical protein
MSKYKDSTLKYYDICRTKTHSESLPYCSAGDLIATLNKLADLYSCSIDSINISVDTFDEQGELVGTIEIEKTDEELAAEIDAIKEHRERAKCRKMVSEINSLEGRRALYLKLKKEFSGK